MSIKTTQPDANKKRPFNIEQVRADFPILEKRLSKNRPLVYLDSGASAQKPRRVIEKELDVYETHYANAYRGVYEFGAIIDQELEESRQKVAALLNASSAEEIVFTAGTTMSINMVARGWGGKFLQPGDEILLNEMEHHANLIPWQNIAAERGAKIVYLPLTDDGLLDLESLDQFLTKKTRIVAITSMSNVLGTLPPVEMIAKRAHDVGAMILVDAAQSAPHAPMDLQKMDVDFLAFSGHKLFGPTGVGILYGKRERLEEMDPFLFGGRMIDQVEKHSSTWANSPAKHEGGTIPIAQAIALGSAVDYLNQFNFSELIAHEKKLLDYATHRLSEIPGMKIYGPSIEHKGPIVSFTIAGAHPEDIAQLLNRRGVFVRHGHHCAMLLHKKLGISATVRASFAMYNTRDEIDALFSAIQFARERLRLA